MTLHSRTRTILFCISLILPCSYSNNAVAQKTRLLRFIASAWCAENQEDGLCSQARSIIEDVVTATIEKSITPLGEVSGVPAPALDADSDATPLKVCVVQDKSLSGEKYGTPQLTEEKLTPVLDQIRSAGTSVAAGFLDEKSNWPLEHAYIPPVPPKPERKSSSNPRTKLKYEIEYRKELKKWNDALDLHTADAEQEITDFLNAIRPDLERPASALESDVAGSMVRCDTYLAEPLRDWKDKKVIKVLVMISDSEHDVSTQSRGANNRIHADIPERLESNPIIYVVNSSKHKGDLAGKYDVIAVESIEAAFRDVISLSKTGR